ncbi:MAG: zinc ribbon domain-containing protein [Desulfobacterales bacterium]|nr:zinc ribbon domain-containing protein [Desulfobacterales bacterium]
MSFETREEVLEKIISMEKPKCPHCNMKMSLWEVPPITFGDGLGWGVPYLFVCFNDECSVYINGWNHIRENFSHNASYRCMSYPGTNQFEFMPVFSPVGATGQIIDDQDILQRETIKEAIKKGFSILADCYVSKDWLTVVKILLDPLQPNRVRLKATEMIGDIGEIDVIDAMRNHKFGNEILQKKVEEAIEKIHERYYTRECPFCAEIVKKRAQICKHCGKELKV